MATPTGAIPDQNNPYAVGKASRVDFTIGAEASNVIRVTATVRAPGVANVPTKRQVVQAYLTQNLTTLAIGAAPSGTVVIGTLGSIVIIETAKVAFQIACDADGKFNLDITNTDAGNWYLVVVIGSEAWVSPVIDFTQPVVASLSPATGPEAGGTAFTITGTNLTGATSVTVGGVAATSVVVVSDTSITAVSPAGTGATDPVVVTTPFGTSNNDVTWAYT